MHLFQLQIFAIGFEEFEHEGEEHVFLLHEVHVEVDERLLEEGAGFGQLAIGGAGFDGTTETGENAGAVVADAAVVDLENVVDEEIGGPVFGQRIKGMLIHKLGIFRQR